MTVLDSVEYPDVLVVVSFKLPSRELELLEELAYRFNTSRSELIRRAIRYYISMLHGEVKPFVTKRITVW